MAKSWSTQRTCEMLVTIKTGEATKTFSWIDAFHFPGRELLLMTLQRERVECQCCNFDLLHSSANFSLPMT